MSASSIRPKLESGDTAGASSKNSEAAGKVKRIAACDVCRLRKVKCVKDDGEIGCQGCLSLNRECSYTYTHKKPGPPNPYARPNSSSQDNRYNPYPSIRPAPPHNIRSPQPAPPVSLPYPPYPDPTYTHHSTGSTLNAPLPPTNGYHYEHPDRIPSQSYSRGNDHNPLPNQASPTDSISPYSTVNALKYRNHERSTADNTLMQSAAPRNPPPPPPSSSRPNNQHENNTMKPTSNQQSFLNSYSAEDNWFMPWICSTPGADGQTSAPREGPAKNNTYPLNGPGTGSTHSSGAILPDLIGNWGEMDLDSQSNPHLDGSRRTGTYQTSRMRSQPNSPPALGLGFEGSTSFGHSHTRSVGGGPSNQVKRGSQANSTGGTVGDTPGSVYNTHAQIEDITRWSTALNFLSLYHEHLYPLLPLMHWPTFSQHLVSRRDRHDETFRIFLMSLIAYAILQLPRSVMPDYMSQEELVRLHRRLHHTSRAMQKRDYEPIELLQISTLYCDHIYLGSTGHDNAANVVLAEAMRVAIALGLHDENVAVQQGLDAIEKETRRRVFWSLYGSDRTIAALIACPMLLSDEDIFVSDILEVDDSLITAAGSFQQPPGKTPMLSGFVHVTRIFRLLSQVLRLVRARAHGQPITDDRPDASPDPRELIKSLQSLLDDLPPPLRLQSEGLDPRDSAERNAFDTCRANILVTQVLVRFAIYQYATLMSQGRADQCLDELTEDVLKRLHQMSSESLAANGESIRHKVLFIASSLLNKYPAQDSAGHEHVADFLQVYNKILTNQNKGNLDEEQEGQVE